MTLHSKVQFNYFGTHSEVVAYVYKLCQYLQEESSLYSDLAYESDYAEFLSG